MMNGHLRVPVVFLCEIFVTHD
uniref:Uncharacterized protein n=1 Tax=Anguilla anguilla TaxID=7936 RepID=A0A0E9RMS4_ANGAN